MINYYNLAEKKVKFEIPGEGTYEFKVKNLIKVPSLMNIVEN